MTQLQIVCEACGTGRSIVEGFEYRACPFCATRHFREQKINNNDLPPDQIALPIIGREEANRLFDVELPFFAKDNHFNPKRCEYAIRTPMYVPFWFFDLAIDADGKGPRRPNYAKVREPATQGASIPIAKLIVGYMGEWTPYHTTHADKMPLLMPNISYKDAAKRILLGVQDNLKGRNLSPTRSSGIIGEVGMVTHMQLIPIWLAAYVTNKHRHYMVVNAADGTLHKLEPQSR